MIFIIQERPPLGARADLCSIYSELDISSVPIEKVKENERTTERHPVDRRKAPHLVANIDHLYSSNISDISM